MIAALKCALATGPCEDKPPEPKCLEHRVEIVYVAPQIVPVITCDGPSGLCTSTFVTTPASLAPVSVCVRYELVAPLVVAPAVDVVPAPVTP